MPIGPEHVGRTYPPTPPYEVSAAKITEFATAIGDASPAYRGDAPTAPPTFATVIAASTWDSLFTDPELDLALRRVVHGDQRFTHARALRAGDRVTARLRIDKVRNRDTTDMINSTVTITTLDGEDVCTAEATFLHSRESGSDAGAEDDA